jgi:hypothetical protein
MHLQAAFLFAKEIGKFFALTTLDLLKWITQWRHDIKILKISAVDLETMLFQCISIKKFPNLVKLFLWIKLIAVIIVTVVFVLVTHIVLLVICIIYNHCQYHTVHTGALTLITVQPGLLLKPLIVVAVQLAHLQWTAHRHRRSSTHQ